MNGSSYPSESKLEVEISPELSPNGSFMVVHRPSKGTSYAYLNTRSDQKLGHWLFIQSRYTTFLPFLLFTRNPSGFLELI